jgi:hypothetical protein
MRPFETSVFVSALLPAVVLIASSLGAQTLQQRPPAKPVPPVESTLPSENSGAPAVWKPVLPQGTSLQVEITRHYPVKDHGSIEGRLLHPIFAEGMLAVPENTPVRGAVVALEPDVKARWHGRLRGDFTPFHISQVQFNELMLPSGALAISTNIADNGAQVLHLVAPGAAPRQSLLAKAWSQAKGQLLDQVTYFTAPELGDRALQALYRQLPYHPERIEAHTAWSFELTAPLPLPAFPLAEPPPAPPAPRRPGKPEIWSVQAILTADLTSATAKPGDPVKALVVEPVFDQNADLVVPQGSMLVGKVSSAKAARSLGRNGKLRFTFQQVRFPEGTGQAVPDRPVQGALAGATAESLQSLSLDAEGTVTSHNQSSVIAPLLLTVLAGRALDEDGNLTAQTGVASNGFGMVGRVVGLAAGNRNLAAGIGYYAAALSIYENFLRRGHDVTFQKNTRIEIETTPLRAPVLTPDSP